MKKYLWEILVPAQGPLVVAGKAIAAKNAQIPVAYHRLWDLQVMQIAGGLTIMRTAKGGWASIHWDDVYIYCEDMIPVRIMGTEKQIIEIADITARHYRQKAVMYYKITDNVVIRRYDTTTEPFQPR
jgi:hypothetical protein